MYTLHFQEIWTPLVPNRKLSPAAALLGGQIHLHMIPRKTGSIANTTPLAPLAQGVPGKSSKWRRFDPVTAEATSLCGSRPVAVRGPRGRCSRWRRQVFSLCVLRSRALLCRGSEGVRFRSWPEGQAGPENLRSNAEPMWKPRGLALS